jgi:AGCS family alanine or glycine:cation symporter
MRRGVWIAAGLLASVTTTARAEDSVLERLDAGFGAYFVDPMASVLFYDIVFWDNDLPPEAADGQVVGDRRYVSHDGATLTYHQRSTENLADLTPIFDLPVIRQFGSVAVEIRSTDAGVEGRVVDAPVDAAALGLTLTPGVRGEAAVTTLAPFPVRVDLATGRLIPDQIPAVHVRMDPAPDQSARTAAGALVKVLTVDGEQASVEAIDAATTTDPLKNPENAQLPAVVAWLVAGALFFTFRMQFIAIRGFSHAIRVTAGHYDDEHDPGEISHFQALSSALSATVGLGNIAGVAIAVSTGGPGAVFWMTVSAMLGMSSKFVECTLGQMYRVVRPDGSVSGGPMHYLSAGLTELGLKPLGSVLSISFALMCIGGSFGGGNMFQANQSFAAVADAVPGLKASAAVAFSGPAGTEIPAGTELRVGKDGPAFRLEAPIKLTEGSAVAAEVVAVRAGLDGDVPAGAITTFTKPIPGVTIESGAATGGSVGAIGFGIALAVMVGAVIIGGIRRIAAVADKIVPLMCGVYVLAGMTVVLANASAVPAAALKIVELAFTPEAGIGGVIGVMAIGFKRASFSNEAGIGSASIAHSAAATTEPVREGIVALLEPFIDTIIVCNMTGIVMVVSGAYELQGLDGVVLTARAFETVLPWFPAVLTFSVFLFAYSTMISWSYYGERCTTWLVGEWARMPYRVVFVVFTFLGAVLQVDNVLTFSDLMVLGMAFPNILGAVLLSTKVKHALDDYMGKLQRGEFQTTH